MHRRLPHIRAPGLVQHVVFCVRGAFTAKLPDTPERIDIADHLLDTSQDGRILSGAAAAAVGDVLIHGEPDQYRLLAWCVMPNHVHALIKPNKDVSLVTIVQRWKSISAHAINPLLSRRGPLWQANYFDRYMRDEAQVDATMDYIEMNPVAAGLVQHPWLWRWSSAYRA